MRWAWLLLAVASCLEPSLVTCPESGLVCPVGTSCDDAHHTCVTPEQQQACVGMADGTSCTAGTIVGFCTDQLCLPLVCGNSIVEPGEVCDDGNAISGDGCNATCTSTEVCGNGFVDPGETCDDANRMSGDGCDSRCQTEHEVWTVTGVGMRYRGPGHTVHDPVHHQLVHVADAVAWTWDGTTWSLLSANAFGDQDWGWDQLVFDSDRGSVILVGQPQSLPITRVAWEWNGTAWTQLPLVGSGPNFGSGALVAYDSVRHEVLAIGTTNAVYLEMWALDLATGVWTQEPPPTPTLLAGGQGFAFDATRGVAVLVQDATTVFEWNGTAWTAHIAPAMAEPTGWAIAYDPSVGGVSAIGGDGAATTVQKWTGNAWTTLAPMPVGRSVPDVAYDADRDRLVVFAGKDAAAGDLHDLLERHGTSWTNVPIVAPTFTEGFGEVFYAYDPKRDMLLTLGGPASNGMTDLWGWDGVWHQLPPLPVTYSSAASAITYDPVRDGFVVNAGDASTWLFRNNAWTTIQPAGTSEVTGYIIAATYDPSRHAIIGSDNYATWVLGSTSTTWIQIAGPPTTTGFYQSWSFDARTNQLVVLGLQNGYELAGATWKQTLAPGDTFKVTADARRGSLVFVGQQGSTYERIAGVWHESPPLAPSMRFGFGITYAPRAGTLMVLGSTAYSRLLFRRTYVGASLLDACDGSDTDGDGLTGCADPDCWLECTPACPPYASCP